MPEPAALGTAAYRPPRLALSVGITGHRPNRLPESIRGTVARRLRDILERLRAGLEAEQADLPGCFSDEAPLLRVVSPLAEGADTLAAEAALATGCELDICLPFHRDDYARDFETAAARDHFHALLGRGCEVIELAGSRRSEAAAYESVGRLTLTVSDVMIAVWDGAPANGRGGTAEIIGEAVERGIPVIHVALDESVEPCIIWTGLSELPLARPTLWTTPRCCLAECLADMVHLLVAPPTRGERPDAFDDLARPAKRTLRSHFAWPLLLYVLRVRNWHRTDCRPATPEQIAAGNRAMLDNEDDDFSRRIKRSLIGISAQADALANQFGQAHRSGFVLNFALAALAVGFAAWGVVVDDDAKSLLVFGELVLIMLIVGNTYRGRQGRWHRRWLDYRHLAERLRILVFTLPIGEQLLRFDFDPSAGGIPDWVRWRVRASARAAGMPSFIVTPALIDKMRQRLFGVMDGQIAYHRGNATRMHLLDHRTHRLGGALVVITVLVCVLYLLDHWEMLPLADLPLREVTVMVTICLPAVGAALFGIRAQSDFAGIEHRSLAMARELGRLRQTIEADAPRFELITDRARRLATVMLRDTADWRLTFEGRPLVLPG